MTKPIGEMCPPSIQARVDAVGNALGVKLPDCADIKADGIAEGGITATQNGHAGNVRILEVANDGKVYRSQYCGAMSSPQCHDFSRVDQNVSVGQEKLAAARRIILGE